MSKKRRWIHNVHRKVFTSIHQTTEMHVLRLRPEHDYVNTSTGYNPAVIYNNLGQTKPFDEYEILWDQVRVKKVTWTFYLNNMENWNNTGVNPQSTDNLKLPVIYSVYDDDAQGRNYLNKSSFMSHPGSRKQIMRPGKGYKFTLYPKAIQPMFQGLNSYNRSLGWCNTDLVKKNWNSCNSHMIFIDNLRRDPDPHSKNLSTNIENTIHVTYQWRGV